MGERYRYLSRNNRYNREASYYNSDVEVRNNKRIEANNKRRNYEDEKYSSIAIMIINELNKRKIDISSADFYENLGNIIDTVLESRLIKECYTDLNAETLKNVVLRRINKINEIER